MMLIEGHAVLGVFALAYTTGFNVMLLKWGRMRSEIGFKEVLLTGVTVIFMLIASADFYTGIGLCSNPGCNPREHGFWECLYFSIITFTTVGYGDFTPSPVARILAGGEALAGYVNFGIFLALLTGFIQGTDAKTPFKWRSPVIFHTGIYSFLITWIMLHAIGLIEWQSPLMWAVRLWVISIDLAR
jgi:hypothetical protein